jgi:hypothetical protein
MTALWMVLMVLRDAEVDAGDRCIGLRLSVSSQMARQAADSRVGQWEFANYKVTLPEARTRTLVPTPLRKNCATYLSVQDAPIILQRCLLGSCYSFG